MEMRDKNGTVLKKADMVYHNCHGLGDVQALDVPVAGGGYNVHVKWDDPDGPPPECGGVSAEMLEVRKYVIKGAPKRPLRRSAPAPGLWASPAAHPKLSRKQRRAARLAANPHFAKNDLKNVKAREAAIAKREEKLMLDEVAFAMAEVEQQEVLAAEKRAVKTTHEKVKRQLDFAYKMQHDFEEKVKNEKEMAVNAKNKEEADAVELARMEAAQEMNMKKREVRLNNLNGQIASEKEAAKVRVDKYIAKVASEIAAKAVAAVLQRAVEADRVERARYASLQEAVADAADSAVTFEDLFGSSDSD